MAEKVELGNYDIDIPPTGDKEYNSKSKSMDKQDKKPYILERRITRIEIVKIPAHSLEEAEKIASRLACEGIIQGPSEEFVEKIEAIEAWEGTK